MREATLLIPSALSTLPLEQIHLNQQNPRILKEERFKQLVASLVEFPEMLSLRPLVVDEAGVVLGGNMRTRAVLHLVGLPENEKQGRIEHAVFHRGLELDSMGNTVAQATPAQKDAYRAALATLFYATSLPVTQALNLTEAQKREFVVKDNASFGEWNWDELANGQWGDAATLNDWGLNVPKEWSTEMEVELAPEVLGEISLPEGEPEFKQMTFTLTREQAQDVETALAIAKKQEGYDLETGNDNKNGNALAWIVQQLNAQHNFTVDDDTDPDTL